MTFDLACARERLAQVDPLIRRAIEWEMALSAPPAPPLNPRRVPPPPPREKPLSDRQMATLRRLILLGGGTLPGNLDVANDVRAIRLRLGEDAIVNDRGCGYRLTEFGMSAARGALA